MIIKAKPLPKFFLFPAYFRVSQFLLKGFNKKVIDQIDIKPGHSYLLMCNHFSFLDGPLSVYLAMHGIHKKQKINGLYIMSLKKQMQKNFWLKYIGAFSVAPHSRTVEESLDYAANVLSTPGNVLLMYPQGNLESSHIRKIVLKEGIEAIVKNIKGDCQLIWSSNIIEYFESTKPSVYFNMLDCGTNKDFNLDDLKEKVNNHHQLSIKKNFRFTEEAD